MKYLLMVLIAVPVFAGLEVISPQTITLPEYEGVPQHNPWQPETLFYDDGTIHGAWAWYTPGNGWGYHFSCGGQSCDIVAVGYRIYDGWPNPGLDRFMYRVTDWDGSAPSTTYDEGSINKVTGAWTWYDLPSVILDTDGEFCLFYIQEGDYPNCCGLSEDGAQEDPTPDWWVNGTTYGPGFPRNDFLIRVAVNIPSGVAEQSTKNLSQARFPSITNGSFNIWFGFEKPTEVTLSAYDLTGKLVVHTESMVQDKLPVDMRNLPDGVYFLRLEGGSEAKTGKIILVH